MFRIIIVVALLLYIIYYITVIFQFLGLIKMSNRVPNIIRCLIPFYFWIVSNDDKINYIEIKLNFKDETDV